MIRDLFHTPPIFKAKLVLSFKPQTEGKAGGAGGGPQPGQKRKPITFGSSGGGAGGKRQVP